MSWFIKDLKDFENFIYCICVYMPQHRCGEGTTHGRRVPYHIRSSVLAANAEILF